MSDGKSGTYVVVSATELRRRAMAAARDRLDRAVALLGQVAVGASAAEATYGSLGITVAQSPLLLPSGDDPEVWEEAAARLERECAAFQRQTEQAVVAARSMHLASLTADLLASLRPEAGLAPSLATHAPSAAAHVEKAREIAARLPAGAPAEVAERCERLVSDVASAGSEARRETVLAALRSEVQRAREKQVLVERNSVELGRLHALLDGSRGEDAESMRGYLRGLRVDARLPSDLGARVEAERAAARGAADREFALLVTREALADEGYQLGEDFVTVVGTADGALLSLAGSHRHGVRVRERGGQILFNVVRFDETGLFDPTRDTAAAATFCDSFGRVVEAASGRGLELERVVHHAPGSGHLELRHQPSPFRAGTGGDQDQSASETERKRSR